MTELLALPIAPVATPPALLDPAITASTVTPVDPFAAFMATAQITPVVTAALPPVISPALPAIAEAALPQDKQTSEEEEVPDASSDEQTLTIDPALSPALALLTALVTPKADAPRLSATAPGRSATAAVTLQTFRPRPLLPSQGDEDEPSDPAIPMELLAAATPPGEQIAIEIPESGGTEVPVLAEIVASTDAPPVQPKTRMLPPAVAKDDAALAASTPRRADRAEQAPAPVRHMIGLDARPVDTIVLSAPAAVADVAYSDNIAAVPATDQLVQRQLTMADDGRWLDSLARDIAQSATGDTLRFKLEPVNLGSLTVAIAQGSDGAAIRLTAETQRTRDLLVDAQPALVAEARANGMRISETHVDVGGGNRDNNSGNTPQSWGQQLLPNSFTGQQAMRQDGHARRQPDLPTPTPQQTRLPAARARALASGERFA